MRFLICIFYLGCSEIVKLLLIMSAFWPPCVLRMRRFLSKFNNSQCSYWYPAIYTITNPSFVLVFQEIPIVCITITLIFPDFRHFLTHCQSLMLTKTRWDFSVLTKTRWSVFPKAFFERTSLFGTLLSMVFGSAMQDCRLAYFTETKFCSFQYTCYQASLKFPPMAGVSVSKYGLLYANVIT